MFPILDEVTIRTAATVREDEVQRLLLERAVRKENRDLEPRRWRWRVEPGKEADFEYLRSSLFLGQRDVVVETKPAPSQTGVGLGRPAHETAPERHRISWSNWLAACRRWSWVRAAAYPAGRCFLGLRRRLLQWGDESRRPRRAGSGP